VSDDVGVDTNIWEYAYVAPDVDKGDELFAEARAFLDALLADASRAIVLSTYQVAETLEILRKVGLAPEDRQAVHDLFFSDRCRVVPCSLEVTQQAFTLSTKSGIHIWDYLVALPLQGLVEVIYTADKHFEHEHFQDIARIENPLSWVMCEGQAPQKKT